ncbi:autotransporter outer membrane beta-barrel domain-containing protein [Brucella pituitosa]|uniref:Autotransporter outer membrane beta-barrel domain-containing protein n=1 Tax=Brucella pituitosa TaxID=571256 RepID=A0ABS3K2Y4_9HYPH|nr:autotransporter outer membrane beta-barrel domain-containing protein [Brucella pituitosa]MBO1041272.1 autotransporter outer membrane beta-barrel domain-containing protein [Brucella pituitosa]
MYMNLTQLFVHTRSGNFRSSVSHRTLALAGTAIALSLTGAANAANFTASNETELVAAINQANASGDTNSTITMVGSFTVAPGSLPQVTTNLRIETAGNTLTSSVGNLALNVATGSELTIDGSIRTQGVNGFSGAIVKNGGGTLNITGGPSAVFWSLKTTDGDLIFKDGAQLTYDTSKSSGTGALSTALFDGGRTITVTGAGTVVTEKGGALIEGTDGATLNVENGGKFVSTVSTNMAFTAGTKAAINVNGADSAYESGWLRVSRGYVAINVTDGGSLTTGLMQVGVWANANTAANGIQDLGGTADILVSDAGSVMTVTNPFLLTRGSLSILNGGVVSAGGMRIGFYDRNLTKDAVADVIVSGAGSQLITTNTVVNSFVLGGGNGNFVKKGTLTINNGGEVIVAGGAGTIELAKTTGSEGAINIGGAAGQAAEKAGALSAGKIQFGAGSGTLNFNHIENNYDFGIALEGNGTVSQIGSGKTTLTTDQTAFTGQTRVQSGILAVDHKLGGTMDVSGGRLQGIGTIGDTVLSKGGVIAAGNASLGTLTIDGDYTGNGGLLEIETVLGDDTSATDKLVITGNSSGDTDVKLINRDGLGAQTDKGIKIIEVGGQSDGTFALVSDYTTKDGKKVVIGGAYAYELLKNAKSDPADGDWYLVSEVYKTDPVDSGNGNSNGNNNGGSTETTPRYSAAVPVYQSYMTTLQSLNKLPTLQQRVGERYQDGTPVAADGQNGGQNLAIWGRIEGAHSSLKNNSSSGRLQQDIDTYVMQSGVDGQFYESDKGRLIGGITGQYGNAQNNVTAFAGDGTIKTQSWGLGGTLTWYGSNGFYVDGQAQANWYDSDLKIDDVNSFTNGHNAFGYALSIESGQTFAVNNNWSLTPQAQLMWSSLDFNSFRDSYGTQVDKNDGDSLTARLGLAANYRNGWKGDDGRAVNTQVYGIANLYQELSGNSKINVADVKLANDEDRTWAGLGAGGAYAWSDNTYAVYGEGSVNTSLNHFADSYIVKGTVGFKMKW